jgi:hypothetical protein
MLINLSSLWQNTSANQNQLKGGKLYFGLWFQNIVTWLCCFWACGKAEHHGRENVVEPICLPQEAKKEGG